VDRPKIDALTQLVRTNQNKKRLPRSRHQSIWLSHNLLLLNFLLPLNLTGDRPDALP